MTEKIKKGLRLIILAYSTIALQALTNAICVIFLYGDEGVCLERYVYKDFLKRNDYLIGTYTYLLQYSVFYFPIYVIVFFLLKRFVNNIYVMILISNIILLTFYFSFFPNMVLFVNCIPSLNAGLIWWGNTLIVALIIDCTNLKKLGYFKGIFSVLQ
jgi:hypothetical protein